MKCKKHAFTGLYGDICVVCGTKRHEAEEEARSIIFRFNSKEAKQNFLADLCDGRGENMCGLKWPAGTKLFDAEIVDVELFDEYGRIRYL